MACSTKKELFNHSRCAVELVCYGGDINTLVLECASCNEVLFEFNELPLEEPLAAIKEGSRRIFKHNDPARTEEKELAVRHNSECEILGLCLPPECDEEVIMYNIKFNDGFKTTVFVDELYNPS